VNAALAGASVAALAMLAAAGVIAGFRRRDPVPVRPLGDPLLDRRLALERSLADLDDARTEGALEEPEFVRLRDATLERLDRVDEALATRAERETDPVEAPARSAGVVPSWAVGLLLAAVVGAVVLSSLTRESATPEQTVSAPGGSGNPLAFFEQRVADHPNDVAARLDLGRRYLDGRRYDDALDQYLTVLDLDPDDAEAYAQIGLILLIGDRPNRALDTMDRALEIAPDYPEALLYKGVILLEPGVDRPQDAIAALERYLEVAPFGAERDRAQRLIEEARAELDPSA
jgi:tetratricopeptide (TPR) repeat protein